MNLPLDRAKALRRLADSAPKKKRSEAAKIVATYRSLIRRAIRRGHSADAIAAELRLTKRTLQRHLNLAGLYFRQPRTGKGTVIRPYKLRKKLA